MARITWVGVPKDARKGLRAKLREMKGEEFLVCSEKGRDQKARTYIRDSLWAFRPEFIAGHARGSLDDRAIKALGEAQGKLCEGANELVYCMIRSFKRFWREAVRADGYAHFLNTYDGRETEIRAGKDNDRFYIYQLN